MSDGGPSDRTTHRDGSLHAGADIGGVSETNLPMDVAIDPVCGMTVDPVASKHRFEYGGHTFHFCSAGCREKFAASPDMYLNQGTKAGPSMDRHAGPRPPNAAGSESAAATVIDPVCGMTVDPASSKHRFNHEGQTFHFCSAGCREKFSANPNHYLNPEITKFAPPAAANAIQKRRVISVNSWFSGA